MKRNFITVLLCALFAFTLGASAHNNQTSVCAELSKTGSESLPKVYMFKHISSENLVKIYEALGREAKGKVAVKLSTGEPGGHNFLQPELIKALVQKVNGTIVECNTAYGGGRSNTESHLKAAEDHGFTAIAKVDIMDAEGETELPVKGGRHLTRDIVGKNYLNYDFTIIRWGNPKQDDFLESMAEAAKAVADHCGENILYISVANNLSVDCDCDSSPEDPKMGDIGILASLDPVALDRACTDLVRSSADHGKIHLIERIDSRHGMHTLEHAEAIGLGSQKYQLITLD